MYCNHCSKNVVPFCPDCGQPLEALSCPHCGNQVKQEWKACPVCGEKLLTNNTVTLGPRSTASHTNSPGDVRSSASGMSKNDLEQVSSHCQEYNLQMVKESSRNCYIDKHAHLNLDLWRKAADVNLPDGLFLVGLCYEFGILVPEDKKTSCALYRRAADMGHASSQYALGCLLQESAPEEVNDLWLSATEKNYAPAMFALGYAYKNGLGVKPDEKKSTQMYKRAAELGDPSAQMFYGMHLHIGIGTKKDDAEADKWLTLAAKAGKEDAIKFLTQMKNTEADGKEKVISLDSDFCLRQSLKREKGRNVGDCLLCKHPVIEYMRHYIDDSSEGEAQFCPNCGGFVHEDCAKGWLQNKCPLCKQKLVMIKQPY